MILLIDNYDSFSYNLYQLIGSIRDDIKVVRNDEVGIQKIEEMAPEYIFLSPGPKRPEDAGICIETAKYLRVRYRLWACASDIRLYARHSEPRFHMQNSLCTVKHPWQRLIMKARFLRAWIIKLKSQDIIHLRRCPIRCLTA